MFKTVYTMCIYDVIRKTVQMIHYSLREGVFPCEKSTVCFKYSLFITSCMMLIQIVDREQLLFSHCIHLIVYTWIKSDLNFLYSRDGIPSSFSWSVYDMFCSCGRILVALIFTFSNLILSFE